MSYKIFLQDLNFKLKQTVDLSTLNGLKVGINKGSVQVEMFENWCRENNIDCEIILYKSSKDCYKDMNSGKLDSTISTNVSGKEIVKCNWKFILKIGSSPYYFAINKQASEANRKASVDFVNWLVSSDTGKDYMTNKLGNIAPFQSFSDKEKPQDPLAREILNSMESGKKSIPWIFTTFPSQTFKEKFGAALLEYAQGTEDWNHVVDTVKTQWKSEKAATKS